MDELSKNNGGIVSPLTHSDRCTLVEKIPATRLVTDWNQNFQIDIKDELAGCEEIELYVCNETGLRFFQPSSIAGSETLYAQLQKFDWFYMPWKWEHEVLYSSLKKGERVLEVGCGKGGFVEKLKNDGFDVTGIELNSSAAAYANEKGLPVYPLDLRRLRRQSFDLFDVVCSFQVLEHVPDPRLFIEECLTLLKDKGRLAICVPNHQSFLGHQYNLLDMPPHHMTQWCEKSFRSLENILPVKLRLVKYEPLPDYHVEAYLEVKNNLLRAKNPIFRLVMNRFTLPIIKLILKAGLRHLCRGQSIYVEYIKLQTAHA